MHRPELLDYAILKREEGEKIFTYDYEKDMNVFKNNKSVPYISVPRLAEVTTLTEAPREEDSEHTRFLINNLL